MAEATATGTATSPAALLTGAADPAVKPAEGIAQSQETKPADPAKTEVKPADPAKTEAKPAEGAPEKYEDFKFPEGITADPAAVTEFTGLAKELNLSQAAAQRLLDLQSKLTGAAAKAEADAWDTTIQGWVTSAKADKEFGGAKFDENLAIANKFLAKHGTPALNEALVATGVGNHPEFIRLLVRAGRATGEDGKLLTGSAPNKGDDILGAMYPTHQATK